MGKLEELKYKLHDEQEQRWYQNSGNALQVASIGLFLLSVITLIVVWYYSYKYTIAYVNQDSIPLVQKNEGILRSKPLDPGGVIFSNQDKEIYRSLGQDKRGADSVSDERDEAISNASSQAAEINRMLDTLDGKAEEQAAALEAAKMPDAVGSSAEAKPAETKVTETSKPSNMKPAPIAANSAPGTSKVDTPAKPKNIFNALESKAKPANKDNGKSNNTPNSAKSAQLKKSDKTN